MAFDAYTLLSNMLDGKETQTSYAGHLFGGLAGILVGRNIIVNRKTESWEVPFKYATFIFFWIIFLALILCHIVGTLLYTPHFPSSDK